MIRSLNYGYSLQWRHNERDGTSNHQPHDGLPNGLSRRRSKKTSKLRITGLCEGYSPVAGEFPAQRASNAENATIWWRHHVIHCTIYHNTINHAMNMASVTFADNVVGVSSKSRYLVHVTYETSSDWFRYVPLHRGARYLRQLNAPLVLPAEITGAGTTNMNYFVRSGFMNVHRLWDKQEAALVRAS